MLIKGVTLMECKVPFEVFLHPVKIKYIFIP